MIKSMLAVAALAAAISISPVVTIAAFAAAEKMECTESGMDKMNKKIMAMKDEKMKMDAMGHMKMAGESMKAKKMDDCTMQMGDAMKSMGAM